MEDPLCDIIIGNIPEVVKQPNDLLYSGNKIDIQCGRVSLPQQKAPYKQMTNVNLSQEQSCSTKGKALSNSELMSQVHKATETKHEVIQSVVIRQQALTSKTKKVKPLKVPGLQNLSSYQEFKQEQDKDPALHQDRKWAEIKKTRQDDKRGTVISFKMEKGLLYRNVSNKHGVQLKQDQLLVPKNTTVML